MVQYAWLPVMKFVPTDGYEETIDLQAVFTDTGGPGSIRASHPAVLTDREDVNRRYAPVAWGMRGEAKLVLELVTMELHAYVALIVNRLTSESWTCYLSLDGGSTYREVRLQPNGYKGPEPNKEKTYSGGRYELHLRAVDLLDQVPAINTGTW